MESILCLAALKVKITSAEAEGEFLTYNAIVEEVIEKGECAWLWPHLLCNYYKLNWGPEVAQ